VAMMWLSYHCRFTKTDIDIKHHCRFVSATGSDIPMITVASAGLCTDAAVI
jgi:hypothetical protein